MTADQVIQKAFLYAQRKATPPTAGTAKYNALLDIVDSMQKMWASEPETDWDSLYELVALTETASATDVIPLNATIDRVLKHESDPVRIGSTTFKVVRPNQLYKYRDSDAVAQIGRNLKFSRDLSSVLTGETIYVPSQLKVSDITDGADVVEVDDPMWLAAASAAEFDRNDLVKVAQYDNLLAIADQFMQSMKANNGGAVEDIETPWMPEGESWV